MCKDAFRESWKIYRVYVILLVCWVWMILLFNELIKIIKSAQKMFASFA